MINRKEYDQLFLMLTLQTRKITQEENIEKYISTDDLTDIVNTTLLKPNLTSFEIRRDIKNKNTPDAIKENILRTCISNTAARIDAGDDLPPIDVYQISEAIKKNPKLLKELRQTLTPKQLKMLRLSG